MQTTVRPPETQAATGRGLLWLGLALGLLAILAYIAQLSAKILVLPWYMPILGTLGAGLMFFAVVKSRSWVRIGLFVVLALLAAFQWLLVTGITRLPAYTGPVAAGQPFPAFATTLADGTPFTQDDLKGGQNTVLVFYRGHW